MVFKEAQPESPASMDKHEQQMERRKKLGVFTANLDVNNHLSHAGNHVDVLQHAILTLVLEETKQVNSNGIALYDTHAGAGTYDLSGQASQEYLKGAKHLLAFSSTSPPEMEGYVNVLRKYNDGADEVKVYPGSPAIGKELLRSGVDEHHLWEQEDYDDLETFLSGGDASLHNGDGFNMADELSSAKKNVIIIDPPYEEAGGTTKMDFVGVLDTVDKILEVDGRATIIVGIPMHDKEQCKKRKKKLATIAEHRSRGGWVCPTIRVSGAGLQGCSVMVINPPTKCYRSILTTLEWMCKPLTYDYFKCSIDSGVGQDSLER